jgi:hypothetical protein
MLEPTVDGRGWVSLGAKAIAESAGGIAEKGGPLNSLRSADSGEGGWAAYGPGGAVWSFDLVELGAAPAKSRFFALPGMTRL